LLLLVRVEDGAEIVARRPKGAPISAAAWSGSGQILAFGCEDGDAGTIAL
jgi:hypothetical protein